jgi:hypothetical protein
MRFVTSANQRPHTCAFYPQFGGNHEQGFVESDSLIDDFFTPYVSIVALREIAEKIPEAGLAPRSELTLAQAENEALRRENEDLKQQLAEADKFAEAAEWTLNHFGTRVQSKPGRKPAAKAA